MEKKCRNNRNSGFSMVEMLAVVAILVILLGISMVSVVRYRDLLKITELDNAAREIYMAAENRAVLLSGARRLSNQVDKSSGRLTKLTEHDWHSQEEDLYYVSKASMTEDLLKTGSIDPALRNGDFYIVYDKNSGSVTDVFYAEDSLSGLVGSDFADFYKNWAKSRSERLAKKNVMLVGWYNGQAAEGGFFEPDPPKDEPTIKVMIDNGEELTVTVEYEAPAPATLSVRLGSIALTNKRLVGVTLPEGEITVPAGEGSFTWVLDSLKNGQFKELNSGINPGDDFTVEATLTPQNGAPFEAVFDSKGNNSLFREGSGGETAGIGYLRHLQNLDSNFSGVTGKTAAVQTADILCKGNETYGDYDFIPIYNEKLVSYSGGYNPEDKEPYEIRDLYVSGTKFIGDAGLFSKTGGGTSNNSMTFQFIRLVNASVTASEGYCAGALAGSTSDAVIQNCRVYWELDETLKAGLIKDAANNEYNYQVTGKYAGGLVGHAQGSCTITGSLAATLVSGTDCAGGLIGQYDGGTAKVTHSYADCYLTGTGTGSKVAGLVGNVSKTSAVTLQNCYAAGYIMGGSNAAGLCLGEGTTDATNVYSVMRYPNRTIGDKFTFLTGKQASDDFKNTYFLYSEKKEIEVAEGKTISGRSYDEMRASGFVTEMKASFQSKGPADSHPYSLRIPLDVYDYPGLTGMPHYGDWGKELAALSLVYYENDGGTNRVSGIGVRDLDDSTKNVTEDGYALLLRQEDDDKDKTVTVTVKYSYWGQNPELDENGEPKPSTCEKTYTLQEEDARKIVVDGDNSNSYYVLPLPDDLVNSNYPEKEFFRYISFELKKGGEIEPSSKGDAFFNPHFAETVQTAKLEGEGAEGGWTKDKVTAYASNLVKVMGEIKVRTPRHLYDLSQFKEYYTRSNMYHQMLDLDYSTYTKYGIQGTPYAQQPIGKWGEAFTGTYNGDYHVIKNVVPEVSETSQRRYAGLFGYSKGTLSNIVYEMDPEHQVTAYLGDAAQNLYVGALAGGSSGTIDNCAVSGANLRAGASGVRLYVGGLVGQNSGTVRNCAAESARLSANCFQYASVYIGGMVGENAGSCSISTSYAVGRIDAEIDTTVKAARVCGFVGWNYGSISNCYAAVDLSSSGSGESVEIYGFCGMKAGSQSGNVYLDQGNFFYRGASYAAKYAQAGDKAVSTKYAELITEEKAKSLGMGTVWTGTQPDPDKEFPYPAAVKDKAGKYVHYGQYPVPMPLGEMGVFYWEKMVDAEDGGNPTYHISALAVDPQKDTITKRSTLSEAHNDGRVVTDYGYGYYAQNENNASVSLTPDKIAYIKYQEYSNRDTWLNPKHKDFNDYNNGSGKVNSWPENKEADEGLADLMKGYTFHCWDTYREAPRAPDQTNYRDTRSVSGLCLFRNEGDPVLDPNSGTFTLTQGSLKVEFIVNPQFADSMSVKGNGGLTVTDGASTVPPGTQKINPFQVRCGMQLQDINWYDTAYTDVPMSFRDSGEDLNANTVARFPYLSGIMANGKELNRDYYWVQTHDIDWTAEGKAYPLKKNNGTTEFIDGVFFPIAQTRIMKNDQRLPGWFGGSYDGRSYTIKNLKIGLNTYNYQVNTMGLFGAVKGARLKDIVMFSESGKDVVTVKGRSNNNDYPKGTLIKDYDSLNNLTADDYAWYAGGVLVGLAVKDAQGKGEITNCSVAGYTIRDETIRARYETEVKKVENGNGGNKTTTTTTTRSYDVGGAIGGLVGMTDMVMTGCTAAAKIEIVCDHSKGGGAAPVRVGGLVGSTTAMVEKCYTGGEIKVNAKNAAVYAGRLIGGVGMEPVSGAAGTATIQNCYSYLELPGKDGVVKEHYKIGGFGFNAATDIQTVVTNNKGEVKSETNTTGTKANPNKVKLDNNYYLDTAGAAGDGDGTSVTYAQLAGDDVIVDTRKIYDLLTAYSPVTSKIGELNVSGRYSYAPKDRKELQGMDYPFPTILTQTRVSDGMVFRVHYGGWEPKGIVRPDGNGPIELDMFTKPTDAKTLTLSEGVAAGGTWSAEVSDESVVTAEIKNGQLTVTALKANDTPVTVTVKYTAGGKEYSLPITVYVTANVELRPNAVKMFPNDAVTVQLEVIGKDPDKPNANDEERPALPVSGLTNIKVNSLDTALDAKLEGAAITLTSKGAFPEGTKVNVTYEYTQKDLPDSEPVKKTDQISVTLLDLPEGKWSEDGTIWTMDFGSEVSELKAEFADAGNVPEDFKVEVVKDSEGNPTVITLTKPAGAQFPEEGVKLNVTLTLEGLEHKLTVTVPKPEADVPEAESAEAEGEAVILSQEGGTPLGDAEEEMEEQPGGVDPDGAVVSAGMHDGGGVDSDGGGLQRGQAQEQPGGASEVPDPVLGADPDL